MGWPAPGPGVCWNAADGVNAIAARRGAAPRTAFANSGV
jgi:hypothetical protein